MGGGGAEDGISHPFSQSPSAVPGSHPYTFLQPLVHQRGCARGGHPGFSYQGCSEACSTSISRLLQLSVCCVEDLRVVASGHRPLHPQSLRGCVALSDGDHLVCSPFGSSGRLDGLHRSSGSVLPGSGSSGVSSIPPLCVQRSSLPVQSAVLWPIHGSTGLLSGHGSCFRHSPLYGYPHAPISRRLASPVLFSGVPSPGSPDSPQALPRAGHGDQPGEIPPHSIPGGAVSRGGDQRPVFCGFSVARSHFQAAINRRRISVLRLASHELMAVSAEDDFFAGSPGSWRQTVYAVPPAVHQPVLRSCRPLASCSLVRGVSSGSPVVAPPALPILRYVPPPGVSRPRLLVRRLGRRVGCSSGSPRRFQPLGLGAGFSVHQRQRAAGHPARSPPLSVVSAWTDGRGLLRQRHCGGVSPQGGRHQVSHAEHHCSGDPALVGVFSHPSGSSIHTGLQQRPGGRSVSPSPAAAFRVVSQHDRVSVFVSSVAGADRFICDLRESPLLDLFFSLLRPLVGRHGCLPPVLGRSSGLCLSSVCHHSQSPCETPGVSGDGAHPCGSALGTAPLVSGPPPAVAGPSGHPPRSSRPPSPASLSTPLPGSPQATASCLETRAVHQSCRFLLCVSGAIFLGTPSIFAHRLPAPMVCLQILVPFSWPFSISPFSGEGG